MPNFSTPSTARRKKMENITYQPPKALNMGKDEVFDIAEWLSQQHGYAPDRDLWTIVTEELGGTIELKDFSQLEEDASIYVRGLGDFSIELPYALPNETERFCLAHEVGHYVLHYVIPYSQNNKMKPMKAHRYGNDRTEYEANWFAAAYLLPKPQFVSVFDAMSGNHSLIANHFRVPVKLSENRAKSLDLVG